MSSQVVYDEKHFRIYHKIYKKIINPSIWYFTLESNLQEFFDSVLRDIERSSFTLEESLEDKNYKMETDLLSKRNKK